VDRALLEFWSTLLGEAARNPQRLADLTRLLAAGIPGVAAMAAHIQTASGAGSGAYRPATWPLDPEAFQQAVQALAACFGMVPVAQHETLKQECAALKQRLAEAQATIEGLRLELAGSRLGQGDALGGLTQLIDVQRQQFAKLQQEMERFWGRPAEKNTTT
jgi:inorganic triphosphatase YgiF